MAPVASTAHTVVYLAYRVCMFLFLLSATRHSHPVQQPIHHFRLYLSLTLGNLFAVGYVAFGVHRYGGSVRALIGGKWESVRDFLRDWGIAILFWLGSLIVLTTASKLLHAPSPRQVLGFLIPQGRAEIILWLCLSLVVGVCEEIVHRGYFQRQFSAWTKSVPAGITLSAVVFGGGHLYQGGKQAVVLGLFGFLFGLLAEARKSLRPGMMTHAWQDAISGLLLSLRHY